MTDTERKAGMGPTPWHPSASVKDQEFYDQLADAVGPAIVREMLNANKTEHDAAMAARRVVSDSYRALVQHVLDAAITKVRKAEATHSDLKAALEECQKTLALLIDPKANRNISGTGVVNAFALCTKAEATARAALSKLDGVARG